MRFRLAWSLLLLATSAIALDAGGQAAAPDSAVGSVAGTVFDSAAARPLAGARVWIVGTLREAYTDDRGAFRIDGLEPGRHTVTFWHPAPDSVGIVAPRLRVDVSAGTTAAVTLAITVEDARRSAAAPASLVGRVVRPDGAPVPGATARLLESKGTARTDSLGVFVLGDATPAAHTLEVVALGYAPARLMVELRRGAATRVAVTLRRVAMALDTVVVTGPPGAPAGTAAREKRAPRAADWTLTREEIVKRRAADLPHLMRGTPGIAVVPRGTDYVISSSHSSTFCPPVYWVDDVRWDVETEGDAEDNIIPALVPPVAPDEIERVEWYSIAETPMRYRQVTRKGRFCGTLLIFTRAPAPAHASGPAVAPDSDKRETPMD